MHRTEFVQKCGERLKLIRTEYGMSQDKMSGILGLSKKTVVEIEKGRSSLGWTGAVAVCTIFENSEILSAAFGGKPKDIVMALAFDGHEPVYPKTMGGKIWWAEILSNNGYKLQQNILSRHYRILDGEERRICSAFDWEVIERRFDEVSR